MLSLSLNDSLTSLLAYRYSVRVLHLQEQGHAKSQEKKGFVHELNQADGIEVVVWGLFAGPLYGTSNVDGVVH